jgi:diguanylate cyclase (GGDEF)-like protein
MPETDLSGASELSEKIRQRVETTAFVYFGKTIQITLTLGVAEFDQEQGIEGTIKKADDALYKGKRMCKNCVILANNDS